MSVSQYVDLLQRVSQERKTNQSVDGGYMKAVRFESVTTPKLQ